MTAFLSRLRSSLGFGGGSGSQETDDETNTSTTQNTRADGKISPSDKLQNRQTHALRSGGAGKRGREEADQELESERKKMRQTKSDRAAHLAPNYVVPAGARPIEISHPRNEEDIWWSSAGRTSSRPGAGKHIIRDTLNQRRHEAKTRNVFNNSAVSREDPVIGTLPPPSLNSRRNRSSKMVPSTAYIGDGFQDDERQVSKKLKMTNGDTTFRTSNGPIDLTEGDSQEDCFGDVVQHATKNQTSGDTSDKALPFTEESIALRSDRFTRIPPEKKKRKSMDSQGSSQNSNRATPNGVSNSFPWNRQTFNPVHAGVVRNNNGADDVQVVSAPSRTRRESARSVGGIINGDGAQQLSPKRSNSEEELDAVGTLMKSEMVRKANSKRTATMQTQKQQKAVAMGRKSLHRSDGILVPQISIDPQDQVDHNLRNQFVRDSPGERRHSKLRAPQKMQASSDRPPRASLGSEDELAGAKTVESNASRSVSPQKNLRADLSQLRGVQGITSHREVSPSNIKPTNFYSSQQSKSKKKFQTKRERKTGEDKQLRIPVKSVLCRSCYLLEGNIELVWDSESHGFLVEVEGTRQTIPNRDQLVCVSGSEAKKWFEAEKEAMLTVHIKTALSANSNGNIIVGFRDLDGLSTCFSYLFFASGDDVKAIPVSKEKLSTTITKVGSEIREDYKKESRLNSIIHQDAELAGMQHRKNRRTITQPSDLEEDIIFEIDDPPIRQSTRSRMQAANSNVDENTGTRSKYFKRESDSPSRRSSRQSKPVREKSASPPPAVRWTRENKLERWAHSVVYPPEGTARRVTVDFQDLERLDEGEFLNDNIIGFALRQIEESMASEHKEKVLFFNSFFYTALTTKGGKKAFNYDAVKRWTKSKDVFSFPYVVVPINIDLHWFVAIICNLPNLSRKVADQESDVSDDGEMLLDNLDGELQAQRQNSNTMTRDDHTEASGARKLMRELSLSDDGTKPEIDPARQEIAREKRHEPSSSRPSTAGSKKSKKKAPPRQRTFHPDTPGIITLDSFGSPHSIEIRTLKEYLNAEANGKRGMEVLKEDLQGLTAKGIPEQTNFCDCGVYVVGYVEEFAKDPQKFVTKVLQKELDKQADFASFNPSAKRAEIRDELLQLHKEQEAERRAKKIAKKSTAGSSETARIGDPPVATKTQIDNEISTAQAPDSTAFVPLPPTLVNPLETARSTEQEVENQVVNSNDGAEIEHMENAVPRALGDPHPWLSRTGGFIPPSSHTLIPRDEEEHVVDKINYASSNFDQSRPDATVDDPSSDLLSSAQEYLDNEHHAAQQQQTHSTAFRDDEQNQVTSTADRKAADRRRGHAASKHEVVDLINENESFLEVQDSQEGQSLSVRNRIA